MVRVKVCGVTRLEDARLACELGASALGFVFWPESPRFIEPDRARAITDELAPFVATVGLFVDQPVDEIERVATAARLSVIQLHGSESRAHFDAMTRPVIKSVAVDPSIDLSAIDAIPLHVTVLLDVLDPVRRGGSGRTIDWSLARRVAARRPSVLAGGLRADNVGAAIGQVKPAAVDVSSGVESSPGIKDPGKLQAFFEAVRLAGGVA